MLVRRQRTVLGSLLAAATFTHCASPRDPGDATRDAFSETRPISDALIDGASDVRLDSEPGRDVTQPDVIDDIPTVEDTNSIDAPLADSPADVPTIDASLADTSFADAPADRATDTSPPADAGTGWRSVLYPVGWRPVHAGGSPTSDGRFLHDFSFAGYHRGDTAPPVGTGTVRQTVSAADYGNGSMDATTAIQRAIDMTCAAGGGVVQLSSGTFMVRLPTTSTSAPAIRIPCSRLVLRGRGATGSAATRLFMDSPVARMRSMILVAPTSYDTWRGDATTRPERLLTVDAPRPTRTLTIAAVDNFAVGDTVAVHTDLTAAFRAEHHMDAANTGGLGDLWPASTVTGLIYLRRIAAIDAATRTLTLDAPTHYEVLRRDAGRVYETRGYIHEVGLEDFAIGMREHATSAAGTMPGPLGDAADSAYSVTGSAGYDVHASNAIRFDGTGDSWVSGIESYLPPTNASGAHILSTGIRVTSSAYRITVMNCTIQKPQYRGGGGNGYLFDIAGGDNLIVDSRAIEGRHDFVMSSMAASGNVFLRDHSVNARYSDDSHSYLAVGNLYDSVDLDRAWLQGVNRADDSAGAGYTSSQTVFWNTRGLAAHRITVGSGHPTGVLIETSQYGWGYVVGTSAATGATSEVATITYTNSRYAAAEAGPPRDFVEGVGLGGTLVPQSLYEDQLALRRARGE